MHEDQAFSRRQFHALLAAAYGCGTGDSLQARGPGAPRLKGIVHRGVLVRECPLAGETRADGIAPAHPNGLQLARDRFLVLYATRGYRGIDDDRSICYQLRAEGYDGPVLAEGFLSRSIDDWDPLQTGERYFKQHGHPVAFGVPQGAKIDGRTPPHAGLFVAKWRTRAVPTTGDLTGAGHRVGQGVEWVQFRLNAAADDIDVVQPATTMRQQGYETGPLVCSAPKYAWMNQTFVNAVPYQSDGSQWIDANHFAGDRVAALRYAFNSSRDLYEWVETGPYLIDAKGGVAEASVVPWGDEWLVGVRLAGVAIDKPDRPQRGAHGVGWLRTSDPFSGQGELAFPPVPNCQGGRTAFRCADGVVRVFSGDATVFPNNRKPRNKRNPIYAWDVDPDRAWAPSEPRTIFDAWKAEWAATLRPDCVPMCDMIKLMPPIGNKQFLMHRVTFAPTNFPPTEAEIDVCGVYSAELEYDGPVEPLWRFE